MNYLTTTNDIPEQIKLFYKLNLLGESFSEVIIENGKLVIKKGFIYEGIKYYE